MKSCRGNKSSKNWGTSFRDNFREQSSYQKQEVVVEGSISRSPFSSGDVWDEIERNTWTHIFRFDIKHDIYGLYRFHCCTALCDKVNLTEWHLVFIIFPQNQKDTDCFSIGTKGARRVHWSCQEWGNLRRSTVRGKIFPMKSCSKLFRMAWSVVSVGKATRFFTSL